MTLNTNELAKNINLDDFVLEEVNLQKKIKSNKNELRRLLEAETLTNYYQIDKSSSKKRAAKTQEINNNRPKFQQVSYRESRHLIDLKRAKEEAIIKKISRKKTAAKPKDLNLLFNRPTQKKFIKITWPKIKIPTSDFSQRVRISFNFFTTSLLILAVVLSLDFFVDISFLKDKLYTKGAKAISSLENAAELTLNKDLYGASNNFLTAATDFADARQTLNDYNNLMWQIAAHLPIADKQIASIQNLLLAGEQISQSASKLSSVINNLTSNETSEYKLTDKISLLNNSLNDITNDLQLVSTSLNDINKSLIPLDYREQFSVLKDQLPLLVSNLKSSHDNIDLIYQILAPNNKKTYLVLFQNTTELRGTGGFLGSYARLTIEDGEITNLDIPGGGLYDLKGSATKKIISPEPMHLVGSRWQIWDANWWPDFPTSAEKLQWFYESSGQATVDGIITINSNLLPFIMQLTGDVYLEQYDKLLTPYNILPEIQYTVEFDYDLEKNKPKQIIADLAPILIDRIFHLPDDKIADMLELSLNSLREKDIQLYLFDTTLNTKINNLGWDGSLKTSSGDYLMVVNQNIGGGKTDSVIKQTVVLKSEILKDGSIINRLEITRQHQGDPNDIFEKANNVSYIRVYIPEGSELISASGQKPPDPSSFKTIEEDYQEDNHLNEISGQVYFDEKNNTYINNEFGKTVYGMWSQVKPGATNILYLTYKLPFKLNKIESATNLITKFLDLIRPTENEQILNYYNLLIQKQSGTDFDFQSELIIPKNKSFIWSHAGDEQNLSIYENQLLYTDQLDHDQSYAVIIE